MRPCVTQFADAAAECVLHQRVQPARRLVQQEQFGVGGQGSDQGHFLPVSLGVRAGLLAGVQLEQLQEPVPAGAVLAALQPAQQVDHLAAGQVRPQCHVPGDVGQPAVQGRYVTPGVQSQHPDGTGIGAQQAQQQPQGGGLAGPVGAQETVHLAGGHVEVQAVQGRHGPEPLHNAGHFHHSCS